MSTFHSTERMRIALIGMLEGRHAWSGPLPELVAALVEHADAGDAAWFGTLNFDKITEIASEADLARDHLRLWWSGETFSLVRDEILPFDDRDECQALAGKPAQFWHLRYTELLGEMGSQATAETALATEYISSLIAAVEYGKCRFCELAVPPTGRVHRECSASMRRQDAAWILAFIGFVRQRTDPGSVTRAPGLEGKTP